MKTRTENLQAVKQDKVVENKGKDNTKVPQLTSKAVGKIKKNVSALVAASMGRSAVSQTKASCYDDAGYP